MDVKESLWQLLHYAGYLLLLRCLLVYSYRLWFHPLSKYPGPFLAKISNLYAAYHALRMRLHLAAAHDHARYGSVIRHGPNKLIFNTAGGLQDIYQNDRITKSHVYAITQPKPDIFMIFNALDKRMHRSKRRIIGQGINDKAMRRFEPAMTEHIDLFVKLLSEHTRSKGFTNVTTSCKRMGMDVVGRLAFGAELNLQTEETNRFMIRSMIGGNYKHNVEMNGYVIRKITSTIITSVYIKTWLKYLAWLRDIIVARQKEDVHAKADLYSFLAETKDDETGKGLSLDEIWSEAQFFFPAGGDTTSSTLSAAFFYLSRYPDIYARLANEIRSAFTSSEQIHNGPQLASCTYLRAVIDETLRISPPVPCILWREVPPNDPNPAPIVIDGHTLPRDTQLGTSIYALHHNPTYFPDPYVFKPERFLPPAIPASSHPAFAAFSVGARGCAGKSMAYMEASLVLAKTLWFLDFERPDDRASDSLGERTEGHGQGMEFETWDVFSATHDGPNLVFKKRKGVV
ncbi:cytochrome P450 [Dendryphion nanum]|uniref:Cytochrome P450 n=1 Tax=Dendryphion nanum TaxID=256645 RepID=A0A9P9E014_9PLEO|nr:cytochrome P450 [Dendryphion nanum]